MSGTRPVDLAAIFLRQRNEYWVSPEDRHPHRIELQQSEDSSRSIPAAFLLYIRAILFNHCAMNLNLHSQRLILAPFVPDDIDLSFEMFTDPAVLKYAGGVMSQEAIVRSLPNWTKRGGNGCIGIWTISDRRTGEKYGSAALLPIPIEEEHTNYNLVIPGQMPKGDIEIGYFLKRSAWGCGYATEACRRLLQFAFQETALKEVVATFDKGNLASRNVLEKAGFTNRGTMLCYGKEGLNYRITRDEWSKLITA